MIENKLLCAVLVTALFISFSVTPAVAATPTFGAQGGSSGNPQTPVVESVVDTIDSSPGKKELDKILVDADRNCLVYQYNQGGTLSFEERGDCDNSAGTAAKQGGNDSIVVTSLKNLYGNEGMVVECKGSTVERCAEIAKQQQSDGAGKGNVEETEEINLQGHIKLTKDQGDILGYCFLETEDRDFLNCTQEIFKEIYSGNIDFLRHIKNMSALQACKMVLDLGIPQPYPGGLFCFIKNAENIANTNETMETLFNKRSPGGQSDFVAGVVKSPKTVVGTVYQYQPPVESPKAVVGMVNHQSATPLLYASPVVGQRYLFHQAPLAVIRSGYRQHATRSYPYGYH